MTNTRDMETDSLSKSGIQMYLDCDNEMDIEVFKSISSTNTILKEMANNSAKHNKILVSNEQTAGKGRKGKTFYSPSNTGVYFSILLREQLDKASMITVIAAVSICQAIEKISDIKPQIKWVNDIYIDGKKVCGILSESSLSIENGQIEYVILGLGVNIYSPNEKFPTAIEDIAGYLFENQHENIKNKLVAEFLNVFNINFKKYNKEQAINEYKKRSLVIGKKIIVLNQNSKKEARVLDIDQDGSLIVRYDNFSEEKLISGEISIKI